MLKTIKRKRITIKMEVNTSYELDRLNTYFTKEPETISWIETLIKHEDVFYDIGANVGVFSLFAGIFHKKSVKIFAFEPCYHNFHTLCRNIIANGLKNVTPFCLGLSDSTNADVLNIVSNVSGSSGHRIGNSSSQFGKKFRPEFKQGVFSMTLADAVKKFGLPPPII